MSVADRTGTSASSTRSGRVPGTSGRVSASDTSLPLGNGSLNGRPQRPVLPPRISRVVSPAAPSGDPSSPVEQVARSERKELTEGWVLFVGALAALVAVREGLRRLDRTPAAIQVRSVSAADAVGAVFVLKEGLHRLGTWALKTPTTEARR